METIPNPHEELRKSQMVAARTAAGAACLAAEILVYFRREQWDALGDDWSSEKRQAGAQIRHLNRYMRHPHDPKLPELYKRLGQRVDRALYQTHRALYAAITLVEERRLARTRARSVAEYERSRRARLERERERRERRAEKARELAAQPIARPKRPKQAEKPLCGKCGKRPQVSAGLCGPCASWGGNR